MLCLYVSVYQTCSKNKTRTSKEGAGEFYNDDGDPECNMYRETKIDGQMKLPKATFRYHYVCLYVQWLAVEHEFRTAD